MEHAQAAKALGLQAIHGAEVDVTDGVPNAPARHLTLLVEDRRGWRNLCHLLTLAHAHTRPDASRRILLPPSVPLEAVLLRAEGLVCLSGCARQGVRDEPTMRKLLAAFGPDRFRVELQRPFARHDRALNRGLASLARAPRRPHRRDGQRPRARAGARGAAGRVRRHPHPRDARRVGAPAPRQPLPRPRVPARDGRPLRGPPGRGARDGAARRAADVRPHERPRLPLPGRRRRGGRPQARRALLVVLRHPLPEGQPGAGGGARRAWTRSCASSAP